MDILSDGEQAASVRKILMVVDLPAPFGPGKPNVFPGMTSKSMPARPRSRHTLGRPPDPDGRLDRHSRCLLWPVLRLVALIRGLVGAADRLTLPGLAGVLIRGEDSVEAAAGFLQDYLSLGDLRVGTGLRHLHGRHRELPD